MDEPEVAHHGGHDGVLGQASAALHVERAHGLDHVTVDLGAVGRHEHHAVGIAIVRHADVRAAFAHKLGKRLEMGGTAVHVDIGAVEVLVDRDDLRTQAAEGLSARERRGTVPRIERDAHAREVKALREHALNRMLDVDLAGLVNGKGNAHLVARKHRGGVLAFRALFGSSSSTLEAALLDELLDLVFHLVGELIALGVEELDAVVLRRVMRSGDHRAAVGVQLAHEQRNRRRGDDSHRKLGPSRAHDAGGKRRFQHVARQAGVLADHDVLAEEHSRSLSQAIGKLAGELGVRDSADTVGSK